MTEPWLAQPDDEGWYRDEQGRILYCPCCGASAPEGYPYEVLHDGRPDPENDEGGPSRPAG